MNNGAINFNNLPDNDPLWDQIAAEKAVDDAEHGIQLIEPPTRAELRAWVEAQVARFAGPPPADEFHMVQDEAPIAAPLDQPADEADRAFQAEIAAAREAENRALQADREAQRAEHQREQAAAPPVVKAEDEIDIPAHEAAMREAAVVMQAHLMKKAAKAALALEAQKAAEAKQHEEALKRIKERRQNPVYRKKYDADSERALGAYNTRLAVRRDDPYAEFGPSVDTLEKGYEAALYIADRAATMLMAQSSGVLEDFDARAKRVAQDDKDYALAIYIGIKPYSTGFEVTADQFQLYRPGEPMEDVDAYKPMFKY
jgi:hypothetical protein